MITLKSGKRFLDRNRLRRYINRCIRRSFADAVGDELGSSLRRFASLIYGLREKVSAVGKIIFGDDGNDAPIKAANKLLGEAFKFAKDPDRSSGKVSAAQNNLAAFSDLLSKIKRRYLYDNPVLDEGQKARIAKEIINKALVDAGLASDLVFYVNNFNRK